MHKNPLSDNNASKTVWCDRAISDMDQVPSVPNLLPGPGILNLMIWVTMGERFEPIRGSCETLIEFVSRVCLRDSGTAALKRTLRSFQ